MEMQPSLREYLERHGVVFDELQPAPPPPNRPGRPRIERSDAEMVERRRQWNRKYYERLKERLAADKVGTEAPPRLRRDLSSLTPVEKKQIKRDYARAYYAKQRAGLGLRVQKYRPRLSGEEREEARRRGIKSQYAGLRLHEAGILSRTQVMAFSPDEAHQISFLDKIITQMDGSFLGKVGYIGLGGGSFWRSRRAS